MRTRSSIVLLALVVVAFPLSLSAQDRADLQILHVLNRMTFGARPGDVETVRKVGLQKWIQSQLHPESIQEDPTLEERLKPLPT